MGLVDMLAKWRESMAEDAKHDGIAPPPEEEVLRQFLYSGIADFLDAELSEIEESDYESDEDGPWDDTEHRVDVWVNLYANWTPGNPLPKVPSDGTREVQLFPEDDAEAG